MGRVGRALLLVWMTACRAPDDAQGQTGRELVVSRLMPDPASVPDDRGEWIEITNVGRMAADLRGWQLGSANDAGYLIRESVAVPPGGTLLLARDAAARGEGGMRPHMVYSGIVLGNGADWLVLRDPDGAMRDSVSWSAPRRGVALEPRAGRADPGGSGGGGMTGRGLAPPADRRELVVRLLDIGQGDAILIQNGGSTVLVDGGPDRRALARWLDLLGIRDTIDAVVLTHAHGDHLEGLRELFATRRRLTVRRFWANGDPSPTLSYARLPDSVDARVRGGTMLYRDTDDPCADGRSAVCTLTLRGGAKLHVMRPMPDGPGQNDRSAALKLVGPDSASFTMWMAGDAEHPAIEWFLGRSGYARTPGMRADVLKANHHGSCDGVSPRYLDAVRPSLVVASLAARNDYGHMHAQTRAAFQRRGIPWYRTDQNGTITLRSPGTPGGGYTVHVERGARDATGPSDRRSRQPDCARM